ncbi:MAG: hypothetical protein LBM75_04835 [Myxococcales bacterium]|jgi:glucose-1-phosphate adenylyltransferase|nr:hypothetical protein [Myxococcales bacterium]
MRKALGMIFAGGQVADLSVFTARRPKSAVVFGGTYRIVDFALTNMARADIDLVGILTQFRPASLMDHVGSGVFWDLAGLSRGVRFLPPTFGGVGQEQYRGPADALFQNLEFIERSKATDVIAVSGDHVYSMDYRQLLNFHIERDADLTMAFCEVDKNPSRFGIGEINAAGQILGFTEKPTLPRSNFASMSVYVFKREVLVEELRRAIELKEGSDGEAVPTFQIHEVLHRMMGRRRAYGFIHRGSWDYMGTLDEYVATHQKLLGERPVLPIADWQIRTNPLGRQPFPPAPTHLSPGSVIKDALIAQGCVIEGEVLGSVLSKGVRIGKGAVVENSILHDGVVVEENARLIGVVSDKFAHFGKGCSIGEGALVPSEELPRSLTCGASVVGFGVRIPPGQVIGKNCIVHSDIDEDDFARLGGVLDSGKSLFPSDQSFAAHKEVLP